MAVEMAVEPGAVEPGADTETIDVCAATEASKARIEKSAPFFKWFQVLGIPRMSSIEEVKRTYRKLVLLHHPDKSFGDPDSFKAVNKAYKEGVRMCSKRTPEQIEEQRAKEAAKPAPKVKIIKKVKLKKAPKPPKEEKPPAPEVKVNPLDAMDRARKEMNDKLNAEESASAQTSQPGTARRGPKRTAANRPKPVAVNATKAKVSQTITRWDSGSFKGKTMPDEVQTLPAEQAAVWLKDNSCHVIDVRSEKGKGTDLLGASSFTYFQFLTTPEELAPEVHRLREAGKRLLIFSQDGADMGPCGLVGSLLLDVFGFEDEAVFRLQGGYDALQPLLESGADSGVTLEFALNARNALTAARKAQKEADAALARCKADLAIYDAASRDHLDVLAKGTWATEDIAREHLSQLSPLLTPLKLESSLVAMLSNAAMKRPAQRGPFDVMVFTELSTRFAQKLKDLHAENQAAAVAVSEQAVVVKAAQQEVEASTPSKRSRAKDPFFSPKGKASSEAEDAAVAGKERQPWPANLLKPGIAVEETEAARKAATQEAEAGGAADDSTGREEEEDDDEAAAMEEDDEEEGVAVAMEEEEEAAEDMEEDEEEEELSSVIILGDPSATGDVEEEDAGADAK